MYDYLFASKRESRYVPDMDVFAIPSLILSHLELLRKKLPTLTSNYCNENCDCSSRPG